MGCDLVVALGRATADGRTLFGQNSNLRAGQCLALCRADGRAFVAGEKVATPHVELPQVRQTYTVLASRGEGAWGYHHGVNEHQLAAGCTPLPSKMRTAHGHLGGPDLVRLVLERCRAATQAMQLLVELIERHGQEDVDGACGHAFMIADPAEAFVVETLGRHWVCQSVHTVRAVGGTCSVGQDWGRISRGLAGFAIDQGWWPADGSKLDFARAVNEAAAVGVSGARRRTRAQTLLEQQSGHIDPSFLRRLLGDHEEGTGFDADAQAEAGETHLCRHARAAAGLQTAGSLVAQLAPSAEQVPVIWYAFGPPCSAIYFPVFLDGELPPAFTQGGAAMTPKSLWWQTAQLDEQLERDAEQWALARDAFIRLQARFDQEAEEFAAEGKSLKTRGEIEELQRQAALFMEHNLEEFEKVAAGIGQALEAAQPATAATSQAKPVRN